jgi:branched-chain amino acid transport system substrate-binding protein
MIRVGGTGSQNAHYFAEWVRKNHKEIKNVAVCSWDYLFGYQTTGGFQDVFQRLGGAVVQKIWMPLGTADPAPFISRIDTSVDAVYSVFGSVDAIRYLNAYRQFGLKDKLPLLGNFSLTDETVLAGLPADAATGVLTDGRYSAVLPNPQSRALQGLFNASHSDPCSNNVCDGWVSAQTIEAGLKATHNDTQNRRKFAAAFKGIHVNTPRGPMTIDKQLNPVQNVYVRRVDPAGSNLPPGYRLPVQNTVLATFKDATQFWKFQPAGYIARPSYSRDYPPPRAKK